MSGIKKVVIGGAVEAVLHTIFDNRVLQESNEENYNSAKRALLINDLKRQILAFVKRNANSRFKVFIPELYMNKTVSIGFNNFEEPEENDDIISDYSIVIDESFTKCSVTQKAEVGRDIVISIVATK